jgi:ABC-2 type transport system permease protein
MKTVLSLLKLQMDNKSDLLKTASPKTMLPALFKAIALIVLATLGVSFGLSKIFVLGFIINRELLAIVLLLTQAVSLAFAVGNIINTLYLSKDNEMLFCLPVTPNQLFISKILMIYISELAVNACISIPLFVTLGSFSNFGASYYLSVIILIFLLPILPIVVAAFLSIPIMAVIKFLKKHTALSIIVVFSLVAACLWVYISLIGSIVSDFNIADKQYETVRSINATILALGKKVIIYYQLAAAMVSFKGWYVFPLFIALCAVVSVLTVMFTRYFFFKAAMSNLENTIKTVENNKPFKERSILASLFIKEVRCVFRSTTDVFEYFLFTILMPFIVFSYDKLLMTITVNQAGVNMIAGAHVMVVAILAMLSNISSASAISRDGGNFHTSKIIPVDYYTQIFAKFLFNAVFTLIALLVTAVVSMFIYPAWQILLGTLAVAMAAVGHIAYSIDSDIKDPTVNNGGDEKSSTVSKSTPKCLVYGLAVGFIMGMIVILMSSMKNAVIPYIVIIALALVFMIYRVNTLILRINLKYDKIEM